MEAEVERTFSAGGRSLRQSFFPFQLTFQDGHESKNWQARLTGNPLCTVPCTEPCAGPPRQHVRALGSCCTALRFCGSGYSRVRICGLLREALLLPVPLVVLPLCLRVRASLSSFATGPLFFVRWCCLLPLSWSRGSRRGEHCVSERRTHDPCLPPHRSLCGTVLGMTASLFFLC